jgi:MFS family permease
MVALDPAQESSNPKSRLFVGVLIGVTMVAAIISSLGAPLIPSIARSLDISVDEAQWSLTAALLAASVAAPIMGRLGDGKHRRRTIIGGLTIVLIGSIVAGLAQSLFVLIVGRAMQGIGLGIAPVTMAAARDHLPREQGQAVIGLLSVSAAAAVGAGYPISGLIASQIDVHAAFFFGGVMTAVALVAAVRVIPPSRTSRATPLDVPGAVVIAAGLVALLVAIGQGQHWGWGSTTTIALFVIAIVILASWVGLELARDAPLVDLRQLRHRAVLTADLAAIVLGIAMYMFLTLVTEFVQVPQSLSYGIGASSLVAGLCLVPFSVMSVAASRATVWITRRTSPSAVLVSGSAIIAGAGAFFALFHDALWQAFVAMGVIGIGFGGTFAAIPGIITSAVPRHDTGSAMGLYQVIRYIGFSVGSAVAATILAGNTLPSGNQIAERGYVVALWVGTAVCGISAATSWLLSYRVGGRRQSPPDTAGRRVALDDAELSSAGLVGVESDGDELA